LNKGYTLLCENYFFAGPAAFSAAGPAAFSAAGPAAFSAAGPAAFSAAAFSSGDGAGFASSFAGAGFGGSAGGWQPINEKPAKNVIAINNATSFFIPFHLLS
jgi:hypothetical protein